MTDMNNNDILDEYRAAYKDTMGCEPFIERRGSWYFVGADARSTNPYRVKNLKLMAGNLRFRLSQRKAQS